MNRQDGVAVVFLVVALVGVLAGASGAVAGEDTATTESTLQLTSGNSSGGAGAVATGPQAQTSNSIDITHEFRLTPTEPGQIDVQWTFEIPDSVARMNTTLPDGAFESRVSGFDRQDGKLVWREDDQSTRTPTTTFTISVNETTDDGSPKYVDTGDWALIKRPSLASVSYSYYTNQGEPSITRTNVTAGSGVAANAMVYMGDYEMTNRSDHGQEFRLVVPEAATLTEEKSDIFDTVTAASNDLRVGNRDETVTMFAAPTSVPWGVAGLQRGESAFYTVANRSVRDPDNTWVHEYVHTRQAFNTTETTKWFIEASAEYYAAQLTLQQERIEFEEFSDSMSVGANRRYDDVVLANPDSWTDSANYEKGGLVAGDLDRRIRVASDSSASLQTVFQRFNSRSSKTNQRVFIGYFETAGGNSVADTARRFTENTDGPDMWTQQQHNEAFENLPAQFSYTFPAVGSSGFRVRGPYRNGTAPEDGLVTGETLVADIAVENVGGSTGSYDLTVTRDGEPITNRTGTAAAGEVVTETVAIDFSAAGTYRLSTGSDSLGVGVKEPASPTVADVFANRTTIEGSGGVRVTAVVTNEADRPASGVVSVRQGTTTLVEQQVSLDVGESTDIVATTGLSDAGTSVFTAGEQSVEVTVEETQTPTTTPGQATNGPGETDDSGDDDGTNGGRTGDDSDGGTAGSSGPGFGVITALVAVAALLVVGRRVE
jgi:hypothetical protein